MEENTELSCSSEKHPEALLVHGYTQHNQQDKLASYGRSLQEVTPKELIQRGLQYSCHPPWSLRVPQTYFAGRIWSSTLIWSFSKQGRG